MAKKDVIQCDWCERTYDPTKTNWQCPSCGGSNDYKPANDETNNQKNNEENLTADILDLQNDKSENKAFVRLVAFLCIFCLLGIGVKNIFSSRFENTKEEYPKNSTVVEQKNEIELPSDYMMYTLIQADKDGNTATGVNTDKSNRYVLEIPQGIEYISDGAFVNDKSLMAVIFPESLKGIGKKAFEGCYNLAYVHFSEGLQTVGESAFQGTSRYQEDIGYNSLPKSLIEVGDFAMSNFKITELNPDAILGKNAFNYEDYYKKPDENGFVIQGNILLKYMGSDININIPQGVTIIDDKVFYNNESIQSVVMPDSVTHIGDEVFYRADNLKEIAFSQNLKSIGNNTFEDCESLKKVVLPDVFERIGDSVFAGCENLSNIVIPKSITHTYDNSFHNNAWYYDNYPFYGNFILGDMHLVDMYSSPDATAVNIPKGVKSIGTHAVYGNFIEEYIIPEGVLSIQNEALYQITINDDVVIDLPDSLTSIEGQLLSCYNPDGYKIKIKCTNGSYAYEYAVANNYEIILK